MKYADEFRNPDLVQRLCTAIGQTLEQIAIQCDQVASGKIRIMEFCGGHTHSIFRYGLEELLAKCTGNSGAQKQQLTVQMIHGPGCPVCVLPMDRVDKCLAIASQPNVTLCSFGDAMRVPGMQGSLLDAKACGADIRMLYSPLDALAIAKAEPDREVVFFALGFETTMPSTALTVLQAEKQQIGNFSLFCNHILTAPTIEALLQDSSLELDGFIAPGHVAMVIGLDDFQFVSGNYHKPLVISGFEPSDILQSIYMVLQQIARRSAKVENQYKRVVRAHGSQAAQAAIAKVYTPAPITELRGFGQIGNAGVALRPEYQRYDAEQKFGLKEVKMAPFTSESQEAFHRLQKLLQKSRCGDVLKGKIEPVDCPLYGASCQPQSPVGALMVSSEGSCAAYFQHGIRAEKLGA